MLHRPVPKTARLGLSGAALLPTASSQGDGRRVPAVDPPTTPVADLSTSGSAKSAPTGDWGEDDDDDDGDTPNWVHVTCATTLVEMPAALPGAPEGKQR